MSIQQEYATLRDGAKMPLIGLGTWKAEPGVVAKAVEDALRVGYRHLDCACDYGNEQEVGQGIKAAIDAGVCKREDIFVTSKLWNTFHAREHVVPACKRTLKDLGLDYVDLYLIHFPIALKYVDPEVRYPPEWVFDELAPEGPQMIFVDDPISETWAGMEAVHEAGLAKNIGVANFSNALLMDLMKYCKVKPAVNQVEIHPTLQQESLVEWNKKQGVVVTGYSNFGALSYVTFNPFAKALPSLLSENETINAIAKAHNKTQAQVILRWCTQRGIVAIPKSTNTERLKQNLDVFDFKLTDEEMEAMKKEERGYRFNDPGKYAAYPIFD